MVEPFYRDETVTLHCGDALEVSKAYPSDTFDSLVTDPPAGIGFMNADWDKNKGERDKWIAWLEEIMGEVFRTLKPGAHGLVWTLPRTSHWTAMALEDAGFEVRDKIAHVFGQGFAKSRNVGRAIDTELCTLRGQHYWNESSLPKGDKAREGDHVCPLTSEGDEYRGNGTALKPAREDWILVRKPLSESSVAANVLKHHAGALNIDASRIGFKSELDRLSALPASMPCASNSIGTFESRDRSSERPEDFQNSKGRFPSNLILGCACEVEHEDDCAARVLDLQSGKGSNGYRRNPSKPDASDSITYGLFGLRGERGYNDVGGASRFFYVAKASRAEREQYLRDREAVKVNDGRQTPIDNPFQRGETQRKNTHPTVKPISLMQYLVRLITPPNGVVFDPFTGSGTTALACMREGFRFVGSEKELEFVEIARQRIEGLRAELSLPSLDSTPPIVPQRTLAGKAARTFFE